MKNKEIIKKAFEKSIPIMCSYLFVSIAYGVMTVSYTHLANS